MASEAPKRRLNKIVGGSAAVGAMLLAAVAAFEGKSNDPYQDIVGVWTVCYGETRVDMKHYTTAQCQDMLATALGDYATGVLKRNPALKDHPYQLAAATSLAYNIGLANYGKSSAAKAFDRGRWADGCRRMTFWNRAGGKVVKGLVKRRQAEYNICMSDLGDKQ